MLVRAVTAPVILVFAVVNVLEIERSESVLE